MGDWWEAGGRLVETGERLVGGLVGGWWETGGILVRIDGRLVGD